MIEFNGLISGKAEKFYLKKVRQTMGMAMAFVALIMIPMTAFVSVQIRTWIPLICAFVAVGGLTILACIPPSEKEKPERYPYRVYIENESIVSEAKRITLTTCIPDVKMVIDHGEFYEMIFEPGKNKGIIICQKDLLNKGTLESFEALFEGKLKRI